MLLSLLLIACNHAVSWYCKEKMHLQLVPCFCVSQLSCKTLFKAMKQLFTSFIKSDVFIGLLFHCTHERFPHTENPSTDLLFWGRGRVVFPYATFVHISYHLAVV